MTSITRRALGAVSVLAVLAAAGAAQAADPIKVASAGPMTGNLASFGEQLRRGAEQAVKDINAKGGVMGRPLALEIGDDQCDPKQAKSVSIDLAKKGVVFVAGHFCSGSSIPASETYAEEGILQMSPASTNPAFTEGAAAKGWTNVFRTCGRDDQQGAMAGPWIAAKYAGKNVAVIHDKSTYGKGLADLAKAAMNKAGLKDVAYEAITAGEKDYTALVTKLKSLKTDAVYFGGYHPEGALIVKQMREQGMSAPLMSGDSLNTLEFAQLAGKEAAAGTMFTDASNASKLPSAKAAVDAFRAAGYEPEGYTLSSYAAMQAWAAAASKAGSTDAAKVATALRSQDWETVIGKIGFDAKGDLKHAAYVWYVFDKDGKYAELTTN